MDVIIETLTGQPNSTLICENGHETWILSIVASCAVGLSGILPLVLIPAEIGQKMNNENSGDCKFLRLLLSFAVGGLLGDVFLHLLPEAWNASDSVSHFYMGGWILAGIVTFIIIEIMFTVGRAVAPEEETEELSNNNVISEYKHSNGYIKSNSSDSSGKTDKKQIKSSSLSNKRPEVSIHVSGYLNLIANAIDNFSHGLAVAASFIVSTKMGLLTTVAILIHEIPHEVGDFAILLKSGFDRWTAAKAQLSTAFIGVMGAVFALSANSMEDVGRKTTWILPFTAGGFLNIALVNILPDLMKEKDPKESLKQVLCICGGIAIMAFVGLIAE